MKKSLLTRILIGIIGIPAILYVIYIGGFSFLAFMAIVSAISQYEFYKMFRAHKGLESYYVHAIIFGFIWLLITYFAPEYFYHAVLVPTMLFLILNLRGDIIRSTEKFSITVAGYLYIPVLISTLVMIRQLWNYSIMKDGGSWKMVMVLFVAVWINDTFAFAFGSLFGRHKLSPKISPNKSREGSIAGIIGATITVFIFYFCHMLPEFFTLYHTMVLSLILGIFPQLGDLAESMMKRDSGVKDSGTLLLGHGGVLDRFDAIFMTAPAVYLFLDLSLKLIK
ncbi:MAG: phosphatidate cytidylyltransferase [Candidatus Marinimicrobia bacterium]|nr:phosphatidate cytidylyltransferase [Candidatus Neomarinimicrobiota bacterium]